MIRPNNHVDILAKINSGNRVVTSFVFQDLTVLATGQKTEKPKEISNNQPSEPNPYNTVTLAVTAEQAEMLMYLEGQNIKLVLRANTDHEAVELPPISDSEALAKIGHFHASKERSIQVIQGESR
jgi:Flp pilus assembly protein CpaB